jgi:hypothetical protein
MTFTIKPKGTILLLFFFVEVIPRVIFSMDKKLVLELPEERQGFNRVLQEMRERQAALEARMKPPRSDAELHSRSEEEVVYWPEVVRESPPTSFSSATSVASAAALPSPQYNLSQPPRSPQLQRALSRRLKRGASRASRSCGFLPDLTGNKARDASAGSLETAASVVAPTKEELKRQKLFEALRVLNLDGSIDIEPIKKLIKKYGLKAKDPSTGNTLLHELAKLLCEHEIRFKQIGGLLSFYLSEGRFDMIEFEAQNGAGKTAADIIAESTQKIEDLIGKLSEERLTRLQGALEGALACDMADKAASATKKEEE